MTDVDYNLDFSLPHKDSVEAVCVVLWVTPRLKRYVVKLQAFLERYTVTGCVRNSRLESEMVAWHKSSWRNRRMCRQLAGIPEHRHPLSTSLFFCENRGSQFSFSERLACVFSGMTSFSRPGIPASIAA